MTDDDTFCVDYDDIEDTPAHLLIALPHAELDHLIAEAKERGQNARTTWNWLTAIKAEKQRRVEVAKRLDGGAL